MLSDDRLDALATPGGLRQFPDAASFGVGFSSIGFDTALQRRWFFF